LKGFVRKRIVFQGLFNIFDLFIDRNTSKKMVFTMKSGILTCIFILILSGIIYPQTANSWLTFFEKSGYTETPRYDQTMDYFRKFPAETQFASMNTFGISPQGRELNYLVINRKGLNYPEEIRKSGDAVVMVMCGIHAGEIEGKDAMMLLLREMLITKEKFGLLDNLTFIVIPIFNVDGHERVTKYNRINQNGPREMGWRTTAQNLNLNRDFMKADSPEIKAFLKLWAEWKPDIFIDSHTTDGADHQYSVHYSIPVIRLSEGQKKFVEKDFLPFVISETEKDGYLMSPYAGYIDGDPLKGLRDWEATPRFSNGYAGLRKRIGFLIEAHMLKPYKERVFATKSVVESILKSVRNNKNLIVDLNRKADEESVQLTRENKIYPYGYKTTGKADTLFFRGYKQSKEKSLITGAEIIKFSQEKLEGFTPFYGELGAGNELTLPEGYLLPIEWMEILEPVDYHGLEYSMTDKALNAIVERTRFTEVKFRNRPYEGRMIPSFKTITELDTIQIDPEKYVFFPVPQVNSGLLIYLFEPVFDDSFVKWGFFNTIFEEKEYFEDYILEPIAVEMLNSDQNLRMEFEKKLAEEEDFRNNPERRLRFFYERSPYFDSQLNVYPILRVIKILN